MPTSVPTRKLSPAVIGVIAGTCLCAHRVMAQAGGVSGEQVVAGQASVARAGAVTTITASNGAIINYQAFGVAPGQTVQFVQPAATSRVLNRIMGPDPSVIAGTLTANGIVYITNPSGVYFRQGAVVNVGGIYAAAAHLGDADFLAGIDRFTHVSGTVHNDGVIDAQRVALVGQTVINTGQIRAPEGRVVLAAGENVLIGDKGSNIYASIPAATLSGRGSVDNRGSIDAPGGRVTLIAGDTIGSALHHAGVIRASSVDMTGRSVRVSGGVVDASGPAGGQIRVGGGATGTGELPHAQTVEIDDASVLRADGTGGTGGSIVVWSDARTTITGTLSATGRGGGGGLIETSSAGLLDVRPTLIDASSDTGTGGTWLLDPASVRLSTDPTSGGSLGGGAFNPGAASSNLKIQDLVNVLRAGTSVEVRTYAPGQAGSGNIDVDAPINVSFLPGKSATLTLRAASDINFNAGSSVSATRPLGLTLRANDGTGSGAPEPTSGTGGVNIAAGVSITLAGGAFNASGASFTASSGSGIGTGGGAMNLNFAGPVRLSVTTGAGPTSITTTGPNGTVTLGGFLSSSGLLTISNSGLLDVTGGSINAAGGITQSGAGPVRLVGVLTTSDAPVSFASAVTLGGAPASAVFISAGASTLTFGSTLDSAPGSGTGVVLVPTAGGGVWFKGDVGATAPLGGLLVTSTTPVRLGSAGAGGASSMLVRSTGATGLNFFSDVTLDADVRIDAGAGAVLFAKGVDSFGATPRGLSVSSLDTTSFYSGVGATGALGALVTGPGGRVRLGSASDGGAGAVVVNAASVELRQHAVLDADVTVNALADVRAVAGVDSFAGGPARALVVNTPGTTRLDQGAGTGSALASLTTDGPGIAQIDSGSVVTTGVIDIGELLRVGGAVTLNAGGTTFLRSGAAGLTPGAGDLSITNALAWTGGAAAALSPLASLRAMGPASLGGQVYTIKNAPASGAQTFEALLTLTGDSTLNSGGGAVSLPLGVDGGFALAIDHGAGIVTLGPVGQGAALASLTLLGAGRTDVTGAFHVAGLTDVGGDLRVDVPLMLVDGGLKVTGGTTITAPALVVTSANAPQTYLGAINGSADLVLSAGTGLVTLGDAGTTSPMRSLSIPGAATLGGRVVTTRAGGGSGVQNYGGLVTLAGDTDLVSGGGAINFAQDVSGPRTLTIDQGAGTLDFASIGQNAALGALSVLGAGRTTLNGAAHVAGGASFAGALSIKNAVMNFDGGLSVSGPATLDVPAVTITTINAPVSFTGGLDGASDLTIAAGTGAVGLSTTGAQAPLASLRRTGSGTTTLGGSYHVAGLTDLGGSLVIDTALVLVDGGLKVAGATTLNPAGVRVVSVSAPMSFGGSIAGATDLILDPGTATAGLRDVTVRSLNVLGAGTLAGTVRTSNGLTLRALTLTGDSTLWNDAGSMRLLGAIESDATPRGLTLLSGAPTITGLPTIQELRDYPVPIMIGSTIGATSPMAYVRLNNDPGRGIDGRGAVPGVATIVFAKNLTPEGKIPLATLDTGFVHSVRATGDVTVGLNEKITSFGTLALSGSDIRFGDVNTLGSFSVQASSSIVLRARAASSIVGFSDQGTVTTGTDLGADIIVAGSSVTFNRVPTSVGGPVFFSTAQGGGDTNGNLNGFVFQLFGDTLGAGLFADRPAPSNVYALALDLRAQGPTRASTSGTLVPFIVVEPPRVPSETGVSGAMRRQLEEIAIFVRDLGPDELVDFLVGRSMFRDQPGSARPQPGEQLVSVGRLSFDAVRAVLLDYQDIALRKGDMQGVLEAALDAYRQQESGDFEPESFVLFLTGSEAHRPAVSELRRIGQLLDRVEQLGLGPVELRECQRAIVAGVLPGEMSAAELLRSVRVVMASERRQLAIDGPVPG